MDSLQGAGIGRREGTGGGREGKGWRGRGGMGEEERRREIGRKGRWRREVGREGRWRRVALVNMETHPH